MFICTFNNAMVKELENRLKLIQKIKMNNKTLYIFEFNKLVFEKFSDKEIFISNKLYF